MTTITGPGKDPDPVTGDQRVGGPVESVVEQAKEVVSTNGGKILVALGLAFAVALIFRFARG